MSENGDAPLLELQNMIGFDGGIPSGLSIHPDGVHLIYPVGCTVTIEHVHNKRQEFLSGHTNNISCLAISKSGRYIASGQVTYMGFKADIILWDFDSRQLYCKLTLHRNSVEALAFSPSDLYLVSLGGQDDGSIVVWNIERKEAICGSPAQSQSAGLTHCLTYSNTSDDTFISGGKEQVRVWTLSVADRKIRPVDVKTGQVKRTVSCIQVSPDDSFFYCGTTTGDVMAVNMSTFNFQMIGPEKDRFSLGVTALKLLNSGQLLVGAGDGTVCVIGSIADKFKRTKKSKKVGGAATSISLKDQQLSDLSCKLITTCHFDSVNDVVFPEGCADLVATCSTEDIRLWNMRTSQELLRITVPNMTCNTLALLKDGKCIVSGWSDGRIRAYFPESGKPMYTMDNAYGGSVTALTTTSDCEHVISGSNLGHVVVWDVPSASSFARDGGKPMHVTRHYLLKEHKAAVTCIRVKRSDAECISSSTDGSCIIWDLLARCRRQMIRVNTLFKFVCYHPEEHQILTTGAGTLAKRWRNVVPPGLPCFKPERHSAYQTGAGTAFRTILAHFLHWAYCTDRKIGYWETFDASMIRELDGSMSGSVNALDISSNGLYFVSGGDDKLIKVWVYDQGEMTHIGLGHSAPITGVKISPDQRFIVSTSADGAILRWTFPHRG